MPVIPRNLHTKYWLNMTEEKGVMKVSAWLPWQLSYYSNKIVGSCLLCQGTSIQAISGKNFSQSEYVAFSTISQFAFPPLAKAIHRAFDYVNLSNLYSKRAFHSINLSTVGFIIESQSVRIHISFQQKPINKLRFEPENSTDPYAFARIDWDRLVPNIDSIRLKKKELLMCHPGCHGNWVTITTR